MTVQVNGEYINLEDLRVLVEKEVGAPLTDDDWQILVDTLKREAEYLSPGSFGVGNLTIKPVPASAGY